MYYVCGAMPVLRVTLEWLLAGLQAGLWLLLVAGGVHLLRSAAWAFGRRLPSPGSPAELAAPPVVTVQLALRNERYVAERVLRAACALDWPRDRLEVQVLDDSDDETVALVDRVATELRAAGHDAQVIRREGRAGYKAGALQHALGRARGEYLLLLDADCVPAPDLIRRLLPPLLDDAQVAFTQARWSFDNERKSLLTGVQAIILHALFVVEQSRLSALGKPVQFNGTSGIWRKRALEAAGGWLGRGAGASVTEDLDLSYRVQLAGLSGRTLPEVVVQTELPSTMAAFRAQQERWVRGSGEVLRALGRRVLGGSAPAGARLSMLGHLLRHARQPYLVLLALWLPALQLGLVQPRVSVPWAWPAVLAWLWLAVGAYYAATLRRLGRSPLGGFAWAPVVLVLSLGLSIALTLALLRGVFSTGAAEFVRTPKTAGSLAATYRPPRQILSMLEVLLGLGYLALGVRAVQWQAWPTAAADLLLFTPGFLWVGAASLAGGK